MTYDAHEKSIESGRPIELFELILGSETFRWTSAQDDQVISSITYTAIPIKRSKLEQGPDAKGTLELTVPGSNEFARRYISSVPGSEARVRIFRFHRPDTPTPEVRQLFDGVVKAVRFADKGRQAKIAIDPRITGGSRSGPRFVFSSACNHVLYDDDCQVDDTDPSFRYSTGIVTAINGRDITISGLNTFGDGWFDAGYVELVGATDGRLIIKQVGDVCTLLLPFPDSIMGQQVTVFAGCAHDPTACADKFTNFERYGGFPFVPAINPFQTGIDPQACS